ncbi:MAG: hypothetical protein JW738_02515 [Actinobacteria bacterium]|nr:hypothetical protein [Actinomycetota bacterium]
MQWSTRFGDRRLLILLLVTVFAALLTVITGTSFSSWSSVGTGNDCFISFGTWGQAPSVCKVCPCYGISGVRCWAVFLYGKNLHLISSVKLVNNTSVSQAMKAWLINDSLLYLVFDLHDVSSGNYDIIGTTSNSIDYNLCTGFTVHGCCYGGSTDVKNPSAAAISESNPENPANFQVSIINDDPASITVSVQGPLNSQFESAELVSPGTLIYGSITGRSCSACLASFNRGNVSAGPYDLIFKRADGSCLLFENFVIGSSATYLAPVETPSIQPAIAPSITEVTPDRCYPETQVKFIIEGRAFRQDFNFKLLYEGVSISSSNIHFVSETRLECQFDLTGAAPGPYQLVLEDAGGSEHPFAGYIEVESR